MFVYRLSKEKYKNELSGYGASLNGQRWNSRGTEVIYTAESRSLALCEVAVHIPLGILPKDYHMVEIEIPDSVGISEINEDELPGGWNTIPYLPVVQYIGDQFVKKGEYVVLKIPSAVVRGEYNYLLNPAHVDFGKLSIIAAEPFLFDSRLF